MKHISKSEITMLIFGSLLILGCALQLKANASLLEMTRQDYLSETLSEAYEHCSGLDDAELAKYAFEAGQLVDGGELDDCAHAVQAEYIQDDKYFGGAK